MGILERIKGSKASCEKDVCVAEREYASTGHERHCNKSSSKLVLTRGRGDIR